MRNTLSRSESLKSYKLIRLLFKEGQSFFSYPYRIFYLEQPAETNIPVKYLISVSKRKIKTAVKRNHIKRLFRESYRTQKHELFEKLDKGNNQILLAFVYVGKENIDIHQMEEKTHSALKQIINRIKI